MNLIMEKIFMQWEWLRSLCKKPTGRLTPPVFMCFLFVNLLIFGGWFDFGKYARYFSFVHVSFTSTPVRIHLPEFPLNCTAWNNQCTKHQKSFLNNRNPSTRESICPEYFRWIHEDLKHWKTTGITKSILERAQSKAHFRVVILDGKIYVEKLRPSFHSRALFTMWGIVQLLKLYPGKLPDLEIMFNSNDKPDILAKDFQGDPPPPLFRYCSSSENLDIVFPDWSFWGWAEINIKPWTSLLKDIKVGNGKTKWEDRSPYAYWKGNPHVSPQREQLMKCNVTAQNDWNARLHVQDWGAESRKGYMHSNIADQCTHRYKIYIEGIAWSVSEKYILACNSPALLMTLHWYDFFTRGLIPLRHYFPVRENDKCRSLKFAVDWGNNHTEKAKAIGEAGSRFIHEDMKMEYVYDYMFHLLNEYSKLLDYKPNIPRNAIELCSESIACSADGIFRKFMEESLVKSASDSVPCRMPPPYKPQELKAFIDEKDKATKEVEAWEGLYWEKRNMKQQ